MTVAEIEVRIRSILKRIAPRLRDECSREADIFRDFGVESMAALDLLLSLEEEFGVSIPDDRFGEARSIGKLVALVEQFR